MKNELLGEFYIANACSLLKRDQNILDASQPKFIIVILGEQRSCGVNLANAFMTLSVLSCIHTEVFLEIINTWASYLGLLWIT